MQKGMQSVRDMQKTVWRRPRTALYIKDDIISKVRFRNCMIEKMSTSRRHHSSKYRPAIKRRTTALKKLFFIRVH